MKSLFFLRYPLIILLCGFIVRLAGVLFKIRHWPMADELITAGFIMMGVGIFWAVLKLLLLKKPE
jgi:hypothetical protein